MRTAQEIIEEVDNELTFGHHLKISDYNAISIIINRARKEAIEEAAEKASPDFTYFKYHNILTIDKESILSLINDLK